MQIYAFDRSFEGAIAACGAPLVGILAEKLFGFTVCLFPSLMGSALTDPSTVDALLLKQQPSVLQDAWPVCGQYMYDLLLESDSE